MKTNQHTMSNPTANREIEITARNHINPGARILIVDDDPAIRELGAAILILEGYQVEVAEDGAEALARLANGNFDLVFTDRQMPILDGEELVLALRSAGIRIPVIMISGSLAPSPLYAEVAQEISASLPKPIRAAEMLAAIYSALRPTRLGLHAAA
jgi:CheY-like chemotaxis protein